METGPLMEAAMVLPRYVTADVDRHGNPRLYYRAGHGKRVRLRVMPGHPEFEAALTAAREGREWAIGVGPKAAPRVAQPGTLRALVIAYCRSPDFKALDATTQDKRRAILESCLEEAIFANPADSAGDCPVKAVTPDVVERLRARKVDRPEAANGRVKALRRLFKWAGVEPNPASAVRTTTSVTGGHHTWTAEEVAQYWRTHPVGSKARKAMDLFLFTGLRVSDARRFGPPHVRVGVGRIDQWKGRGKKRKVLEFPILPILRASLDACPTRGLTFLETDYGQPYTLAGLGNAMRKWCDEAGLTHCSAHGLRKAGATFAAENGATEQQLMSIFGWDDPRVAADYVRAANRAKMAAMAMHMIVPPSPVGDMREGEGKASKKRNKING